MLYPIELLGRVAVVESKAQRRTACMLTATVKFVMSSVGFLIVGQSCSHICGAATTFARPAYRADCIPANCHHCKLQCTTTSDDPQAVVYIELIVGTRAAIVLLLTRFDTGIRRRNHEQRPFARPQRIGTGRAGNLSFPACRFTRHRSDQSTRPPPSAATSTVGGDDCQRPIAHSLGPRHARRPSI